MLPSPAKNHLAAPFFLFMFPIINQTLCCKILFFLAFLLLTSLASADESETYFNHLITKARVQQLWSQREWQVLLHYSPALFSKDWISLVDDTSFFLAPQGKTSPQAELEATLKHLFITSPDDDKAIACRFPGRLAWLSKALNIKKQYLPQYQCKHLNNWLNNLKADSLTLIFPVSILNSPASMFGHTLLRLDRKSEKKPDLLAWTVSYAARSESEKGLSFAFKGLFGGYPGKFSLTPYYNRVKEYSDIENRDLGEYQLDFNPAEIHSLLLHLWELLPVYFEYYFVDENCAYQLLTLLEAARPALKLSEQFRWDAAPAETVRSLTSIPGLLKNFKYRPSSRQKIRKRANNLSHANQKLARNLVLENIKINDKRLNNKTGRIQAQILELAYEYAAYQDAITQKKRPDITPDKNPINRQLLLHQLLSARSQLNIKSQQPIINQPRHRPDQGHHAHRIGFRYGYEEPEQFLQLDFRWAYHDLFDPSSGLIEGAQLEFFKPAIRYYPQKNRLQLESIDFVNIISAPTRDYFIQPFSWEISAAVKRFRFEENYRPLMGDFRTGIGVSYSLTENSQVSFFANAALNISDDFKQSIALAGGGRTQLITTVTDNWKVGLYAQVMQYFQGITQTSYAFGSTQRLSLGHNNAIVFDISENQEFGESFFAGKLSWQFYF